MLRTIRRAALIFVCAALGPIAAPGRAAQSLAAATQAALPADVPAVVKALLVRLNDDDYRVRQAASRDAERLPPEAVPLLESAMVHGDLSPEVSERLEHVIPMLRRRSTAAKFERQAIEAVDWERQIRLAAYAAGGHANPKWDAQATQAIVIGTRSPATPVSSRDAARIQAACEKAMALGCDDPLLRFIHLRYLNAQRGTTTSDRVVLELSALSDVAWQTPYPAWIKIQLALAPMDLLVTVRPGLNLKALVEVRKEFARAMQLLPDAAAAPDFPSSTLRSAATTLMAARGYCVDKSKKADSLDDFAALLDRCAGNQSMSKTVLAQYRLESAGESEDRVPRGMERRSKELTLAEEQLRAAWALDPDDPTAPTLMINLLRIKGSPRGEMETWYARAMQANPGNLAACRAKLKFLEALPGHDDETLIDFGNECFKTEDWQDRLPFLLTDVHLHLAAYRLDGPKNDHLSDPRAWADVESVYRGYLARSPNAARERSFFASLAWHTGHWDVGLEQVKILGDDLDADQFNGIAEFNYLRRKAMAAVK